MNRLLVAVALLAIAGCAEIKHAPPSAREAAGGTVAAPAPPASSDDDDDDDDVAAPVQSKHADPQKNEASAATSPILRERDTLGARSGSGDRWRGGLAAKNGRLFWVENGKAPGLYSATTSCTAAECVERVTLAHAGTFATNGERLAFGDEATHELQLMDLAAGTSPTLAAMSTSTIRSVTILGDNVFWNDGKVLKRTYTEVHVTVSVAEMREVPDAIAATTNQLVYWAAVDGRQVSCTEASKRLSTCASFAGKFDAMGAYGEHMYYASKDPGEVYRRTGLMADPIALGARGVADFAFDANRVYWVEPGDAPDFANGRLRSARHDSSTSEELARGLPHPVAVAVDGDEVYIACAGTLAKDWTDGQIVRLKR